MKTTRALALLLTASALAACQAGPGAPLGAFRLAPEGVGASVVTAGAPAAPLGDGVLTVHIGGALPAARRLFATLADVDRVVVELSGDALPAPLTQTIDKAALAGGTATATFTGLPAGTFAVRIRALDATGLTIGSDTRSATVAPGATTTVAATVALIPGVFTPRPIPASGGSGGSGGAGGFGGAGVPPEPPDPDGLTVAITLHDNVPVITPPILSTHFLGVPGDDVGQLAVAADGTVWATSGYAFVGDDPVQGPVSDWRGTLQRIPSGAHAPAPPAGAAGQQIIGVPGGTNTLFARAANGKFVVLDSAGATLAGPVQQPLVDVDVAADGKLWGVSGEIGGLPTPQIFGLDPATRVPTALAYPGYAPETAMKVRVDAAGTAWVLAGLGGFPDLESWEFGVRAYDPTRADRFQGYMALGGGSDLARDSRRTVYFVQSGAQTITKLAPDGTEAARFTLNFRFDKIFIDAADRIWAYRGEHYRFGAKYERGYVDPEPTTPLLARLDTDGRILGYYHVGQDVAITELVVTPDNRMWVGTRAHGLLELQL